MVFCGIGSKACLSCRTRRIKCDQASPACSQCLRAGKECSGYRDPVSLMFRDENDKVIDKAVRKARGSKKTSADRKSSTSGAETEAGSASAASSTNNKFENGELALGAANESLASSALKDAGIRFFIENYVTVVSYDSAGELDLTSSPMLPELVKNKTFCNAASSLGFAALSNVKKDLSLMMIARQKYLSTIQDITLVLEDPSKADLGAAFRSIMVLAAFETIACNTASPGSWGIHIDGGQAIMKIRQNTSAELRSSVRVEMMFIFFIYLKCLSRGEQPTESVLILNEQSRKSMTIDDSYAASLAEITYRVIELYIRRRTPQSTNSTTMLEGALLLDEELENWESSLPDRWSFRTIANVDLAYAYNRQSHDYVDMWCARIYNNYRWARIILNQLILVHMAKLGLTSSENTTQLMKSSAVISQMATEICRSVSSHLRRFSVEEAMRYAVPLPSGIFSMLIPIAIAGSTMEVSEDLYNWTVNILEIIENRMGIAQISILISSMKTQRENWKNGREGFFGGPF